MALGGGIFHADEGEPFEHAVLPVCLAIDEVPVELALVNEMDRAVPLQLPVGPLAALDLRPVGAHGLQVFVVEIRVRRGRWVHVHLFLGEL